jgi:hypothetical protein
MILEVILEVRTGVFPAAPEAEKIKKEERALNLRPVDPDYNVMT